MSRDFNGSTQEIVLPVDALLRPGAPVSIAAWINPDTLKTSGIFTTNKTSALHRGYWFSLSGTGGDVEASYGDNDGGSGSGSRRSKVATAVVATGSWQHMACWISGPTSMGIYKNGVDQGGTYSGTGASVAHNTSISGLIGRVAASDFFDGRIAEVGFWGVQLSDAEFLALAHGVPPRRVRPGSLIAYWPIYGVASPEIDMSPNRLNSTSASGTAANHAPVGCPFSVAA